MWKPEALVLVGSDGVEVVDGSSVGIEVAAGLGFG